MEEGTRSTEDQKELEAGTAMIAKKKSTATIPTHCANCGNKELHKLPSWEIPVFRVNMPIELARWCSKCDEEVTAFDGVVRPMLHLEILPQRYWRLRLIKQSHEFMAATGIPVIDVAPNLCKLEMDLDRCYPGFFDDVERIYPSGSIQ